MLKRMVMNKLNAWADSKTQAEFNDIMIKYVFGPIVLGLLLLSTVIESLV